MNSLMQHFILSLVNIYRYHRLHMMCHRLIELCQIWLVYPAQTLDYFLDYLFDYYYFDNHFLIIFDYFFDYSIYEVGSLIANNILLFQTNDFNQKSFYHAINHEWNEYNFYCSRLTRDSNLRFFSLKSLKAAVRAHWNGWFACHTPTKKGEKSWKSIDFTKKCRTLLYDISCYFWTDWAREVGLVAN